MPYSQALQWDPQLSHGGHRVSITWRDVGVEDGLTFNSDERLGLMLGTAFVECFFHILKVVGSES